MEMSTLIARLDHDEFTVSTMFGLWGQGYEVISCYEEKNGFAKLMYLSLCQRT